MKPGCLTSVVEVEHLVDAGDIDPDHIHTPGIFISALVHVPAPVKHIEQRTTRQRDAALEGAL